MAHGLRYYKELTHADGKVVRLELLQKDYAGASMEIGPVCQSLRLDIQGDTEIDAPIVKTSLSMTFVDAPDHVDAKTKKCGNWTEFYTNDATYWQVVVKAKNAGETDFKRVWGGYVTPDSYNEVLVYRGSVTIVARDNIGHLSDFPFDAVGNADGMITLIELIREAWDKIESPMWLDDQAVANADWLMSEGAYAYDTYMNVSAFESKNWYDALESALYAYGLVMRYTGWNNVSFYSLRNMPRMGAYEVDDIDYREPVFESGAERELTPAVKRIEEAVEYKLTDSKSAPMAKSIKFTGASETIPFHSRDFFGDMKWTDIDVSPILNTTGEGWGNSTDYPPLFFNPLAYPCTQVVKDDAQSSIYLATNTDESGASWYAKLFKGKRFTFTMKFGRRIMKTTSVAECFSPMTTIRKVRLSIAASANGISKYQNAEGKWQNDPVILDVPIDGETREISKTVYLESFSKDLSLVLLTIHNITLGEREGEDYDTWYDESEGGGIYVAVQSLTFTEAHGDALCETNRVNTNYDATNNVILSREPKIAPALNDVLFPSIIQNGIFVKSGTQYLPAKLWNWGGQTPQQMAVYNHLQLLCYHAKPNNVLRGTIVNADVTDMQVIWLWHGAEHMFVSGSFNLLSGHIENAVLREFARYEDMWGLLDPADLPDVDGSSVTNVESGSASKNEGARNTINTEVYLGGGNIVLDDYMSDSSENGVMNRVIKAYVDNLWHLDEAGNLVTEHQVLIKNNAIINADLSFVGNGEGGGGGLDEGQLQDYLDLHKYITEDALSSYYTKAESDNRYLASSLLGSNTLIHSGNIGSYAITPVGGTMNGALTSYGGFISYGTPSFTAIRESGWSYLRLQSASQCWDIATTNASDGMLNTPYALEFRGNGQGYWGFALRHNTSSYGIGVFVANGNEASIGFLSNSFASSNKLPQWVIGNKDAETFGFWNTSSARFGITISKEFSTNVEGNICINRPTNYSNNYDEGLRCNLGGSTSWAGVVIGGAAFSTSGTGVGVYSLLVNNQLFRIRQYTTDVLTINTSNQVNINGNLIVAGDVASA